MTAFEYLLNVLHSGKWIGGSESMLFTEGCNDVIVFTLYYSENGQGWWELELWNATSTMSKHVEWRLDKYDEILCPKAWEPSEVVR